MGSSEVVLTVVGIPTTTGDQERLEISNLARREVTKLAETPRFLSFNYYPGAQ